MEPKSSCHSGDSHYDVFLSSAWCGLDKIRSELADWLKQRGYDAFAFERFKDAREWQGLVPAAREAICLDHVSGSRLYVGLFRGTYGRSAEEHRADMAFTDLELFEAFRAGVPVRLYLLSDATPDARLTALLTLVETVLPGTLVPVRSESDLRQRVERDIDICFGHRNPPGRATSLFNRYMRALVIHRKVDDDRSEGLRFLLDQFPVPRLAFDPEVVRQELDEARSVQSYQARLNTTWRVLQRLFHVPWLRDHVYLDLWDEALGLWESAAAWHGLHGFTVAGRLAAANTLVGVRALIASGGEIASLPELIRRGETQTGTQEEWIRLYATGGALASEYYSIAKLAPPWLKVHYLTKAESWVTVASRTFARVPNQAREAGLASILGHIYFEWGRTSEAIPLLEQSLHLREEASLGASSVAEAKVDLGYAYYFTGRRREGEHLIVHGLDAIERHGSPGFRARAKRKVARVYARGWAFHKALHELVELKDLVECYGLNDQGREVRWMSLLPGFFLDRLRAGEFRRYRNRENPD